VNRGFRSFVGLVALLAALGCSGVGATPEAPTETAEAVGMSSARLARLDDAMQVHVDRGELSGAVTLVARHGRIVHFGLVGQRDVEAGQPMTRDTIFRIYSMTKPIVSVAALILYEEGKLLLSDPVSKFIPELSGLSVMKNPTGSIDDTVPALREMTVRDLLTHTSGLSTGSALTGGSPLSQAYRAAGVRGSRSSLRPDAWIRALSGLPLLYQPGTHFHYGVSTDVLGVLISVVSGQPLESFLRERIFDPLGMPDTAFQVPDAKLERFAANYRPGEDGKIALLDSPAASRYRRPPIFASGAGGLVSTTGDYHRFAQMLLAGGEQGGVRILSPKTVELMATNHLSDEEKDVAFLRDWFPGQGFGLGVSVVESVAPGQVLSSVGQNGWGGAAGTYYWVDPEEDLLAVLMVQLLPPGGIPLVPEFKTLVYQAIVD